MAINLDRLTQLLTPITPPSTSGTGAHDYIPTIVFVLINLLLYLAGIITTLAILYGGLLYITAGGNDSQTTKAKGAIINGLIGAVIVLLAFAFIYIIRQLIQF